MKIVSDKETCTGCSACKNVCPRKCISMIDELNVYYAVIDDSKCIRCNACIKACPNNTNIEFKNPIRWIQGYSNDQSARKDSSSGGLAYAIEKSFIESGGYVASCMFSSGKFKFYLTNNLADLHLFQGSKYVKSDPEYIFTEIKRCLKNNRVLFVGLPCQVAGLLNIIPKDMRRDLYTIDLICHGTPTQRLLASFLKSYNVNLEEVSTISFRNKSKMGISTEKPLIYPGVMDKYMMGFLEGLFYTKNCYSCKYAKEARISDLTLGDSWGTELTILEQKKGISLALVISEKGDELLKSSNLFTKDVNRESAVAKNHQLHAPSEEPKQRARFFSNMSKGKNLRWTVTKIYPRKSLKQIVKYLLLRLQILS